METINANMVLFLLILVLWVLPWKGYAVWTAAQTRNKRWFIALILLNTFAILDIIYIFYIAKKTPKDIIRVSKTKI
ncbi:MAG: DUF5652 family protein [Candidatus Paceibacterota bacterium]